MSSVLGVVVVEFTARPCLFAYVWLAFACVCLRLPVAGSQLATHSLSRNSTSQKLPSGFLALD